VPGSVLMRLFSGLGLRLGVRRLDFLLFFEDFEDLGLLERDRSRRSRRDFTGLRDLDLDIFSLLMVLLVIMEGDLEESAELDRDRRAGDRDFRRDDRTDWTLDERDRARLRGDTDRLELLPLLLFLDDFLSGVRLLDLCLLTGLRLGGVRERLLACPTGLRDRPRFRTGLTALRLLLSWPNPRPC